jgi:hypothetical protein
MKRFWATMMIALAAAGLVACGSNYSWNQKLTVTVETPEGIKTGSAVTRVSANVGKQWATGDQRILSLSYGGEATIVDLGRGKYIFALLSSSGFSSTEWLADYAFGPPETNNSDDQITRLNKHYTQYMPPLGPKAVPQKNYPTLVTFTDLNDPKSVRLVDPADIADTFGQGYRLKSIALEITNEDLTKGRIEPLLGWLTQEYPIFIDWTKYPNDHPLQNVNKLSFKRRD